MVGFNFWVCVSHHDHLKLNSFRFSKNKQSAEDDSSSFFSYFVKKFKCGGSSLSLTHIFYSAVAEFLLLLPVPYRLCHIHFPTQSWRHRIWPMISLPTFLRYIALQISLQLHSPISTMTGESSHQSPAAFTPPTPRASGLQGIRSYLLRSTCN